MMKLNINKIRYDVISVMLSLLHHQKCYQPNVTGFFSILGLPNQNFWLRRWM